MTKLPTKAPKLKGEAKTITKKPEITYAAALKDYDLLDGDLRYLGLPASEIRMNRKYDISELENAAAKKKAWAESCKKEKEAKKAAERAVQLKKRDSERQAAERKLSQWQKKSKLEDLKPQSDSKLPADIWIRILETLSSDIEPEGVRGPSVIARDLCNVSRVNKELYLASLPAFQHLGHLCPPINCSFSTFIVSKNRDAILKGDTDTLWDVLFSEPASLTYEQLKDMCAAMALEYNSGRTKSVMAHKLLKTLRMKQPTRYPARLILAVWKERHSTNKPLARLYHEATTVPQSIDSRPSTFEVRGWCINQGFLTVQTLKAVADARRRLWITMLNIIMRRLFWLTTTQFEFDLYYCQHLQLSLANFSRVLHWQGIDLTIFTLIVQTQEAIYQVCSCFFGDSCSL